MAHIRQYSCPNCSYHAEASGGEDRGLEMYTQTVVCEGCKEIRDVPVRKFELPKDSRHLGPDPSAKPQVSAWVKFKLGEATRATKPDVSPAQFPHLQHYWRTLPLKCAESPYHEVRPWFGMQLPLSEDFNSGEGIATAEHSGNSASGRCPRCGQRMLRSQPLATWE